MTAALAAEWGKLRSVRSTYCLLGVAVAIVPLVTLLTWYVVTVYDGLEPERRTHVSMSSPAELACWVAQLCFGVLGALTITNEYANGLIRVTLAAVPRRWPVLAAKAVVLAAVALLTGQLAAFGAELASRWVADGRPIGFNASPLAAEVPLLLSFGLSVAVFALLGLGLGALLRSSVGAITTLCLLWYVVPIVALNLPEPWNHRVGSVTLTDLPRQLAGAAPQGEGKVYLLPPVVALAALAAYALVPLGLAVVLIRRRDA